MSDNKSKDKSGTDSDTESGVYICEPCDFETEVEKKFDDHVASRRHKFYVDKNRRKVERHNRRRFKKKMSKIKTDDSMIKLMIYHYGKGNADRFIAQLILIELKKDTIEDKSFLQTKTGECSQIVSQRINRKNEQEWIIDKTGQTFFMSVLSPVFDYMLSVLEPFVEIKTNFLYKHYEVMESYVYENESRMSTLARNFACDIKDDKLSKPVMRIIAPYYGFNIEPVPPEPEPFYVTDSSSGEEYSDYPSDDQPAINERTDSDYYRKYDSDYTSDESYVTSPEYVYGSATGSDSSDEEDKKKEKTKVTKSKDTKQEKSEKKKEQASKIFEQIEESDKSEKVSVKKEPKKTTKKDSKKEKSPEAPKKVGRPKKILPDISDQSKNDGSGLILKAVALKPKKAPKKQTTRSNKKSSSN